MSYGRSPPNISGMESLKVDNLTYRTSHIELRQAFDKFGEIGDVYIPRDRITKESRGFAFVRYYDRRDAEDAMRYMDGAIIDGRELRVQKARHGRPHYDFRHRGGRGRSNYRGRRDSRRPRAWSYSRSRSRSRDRGRKRHSSRSRSKSHSPYRSSRNFKSKSRSPSRSYSRSKSKSKSRSRSKSNASSSNERSRKSRS